MLLLSALLVTIATVLATAPSSNPGVGGDAAPPSPLAGTNPKGNETTPTEGEKASTCGEIPPRNTSAAALDPCGLEMNVKAPEKFTIHFPTKSHGSFTALCVRRRAPNQVDRIFNLARNGYYDNNVFFRVVKREATAEKPGLGIV